MGTKKLVYVLIGLTILFVLMAYIGTWQTPIRGNGEPVIHTPHGELRIRAGTAFRVTERPGENSPDQELHICLPAGTSYYIYGTIAINTTKEEPADSGTPIIVWIADISGHTSNVTVSQLLAQYQTNRFDFVPIGPENSEYQTLQMVELANTTSK